MTDIMDVTRSKAVMLVGFGSLAKKFYGILCPSCLSCLSISTLYPFLKKKKKNRPGKGFHGHGGHHGRDTLEFMTDMTDGYSLRRSLAICFASLFSLTPLNPYGRSYFSSGVPLRWYSIAYSF